MPPQEQADLWMALRDRMKVNWAELTLQEKKAGESSLLSPSPFLRYAHEDCIEDRWRLQLRVVGLAIACSPRLGARLRSSGFAFNFNKR